mgnify:FL=1
MPTPENEEKLKRIRDVQILIEKLDHLERMLRDDDTILHVKGWGQGSPFHIGVKLYVGAGSETLNMLRCDIRSAIREMVQAYRAEADSELDKILS